MKSLTRYIFEEYNNYRLKDLTAVYNVNPEELIVQAPDSYSESDLQIYLSDTIINDLPSGNNREKFFGKNKDNIYDAYFEYESFEHIGKENADDYEINIEWDNHYDSKVKDEDLSIFKLSKVKYIISFDNFDIKDESSDDNDSTIKYIFKQTESSPENKYPIEILFDEESLEYEK